MDAAESQRCRSPRCQEDAAPGRRFCPGHQESFDRVRNELEEEAARKARKQPKVKPRSAAPTATASKSRIAPRVRLSGNGGRGRRAISDEALAEVRRLHIEEGLTLTAAARAVLPFTSYSNLESCAHGVRMLAKAEGWLRTGRRRTESAQAA